MFEDLKRFFIDSDYFHASLAAVNWAWLLRMLLGGFGVLASRGMVPGLGADSQWWAAIPALMAAFGIRAGDKNDPAIAKQVEELAKGTAAGRPTQS